MPLTSGTLLGPYEVLSLVGAGGMGEVYRARDRRLDRDVAIKILPDAWAADAERIARFDREAKTLAALNHPNIAHIHGLEESNGGRALVMEFVEGPTLADRIAQGPISVDEALTIARQIADALEAAHEQGVIHRDLKPANIKVRADEVVKVLDFGLAKLADPAGPQAGVPGLNTMSPTMTSPVGTSAGLILGTAAYMAPEQARGKAVDKRADIWAFGCIVYEMLTGRRAFDGDDISTTLAAVLKTDPDWSTLPPAIKPGLRRLLVRCLQKDPKERVRDISDARMTIDDVVTETVEESISRATVRPLWRRVATVAGIALITAIVTGVIVWLATRSTAPISVPGARVSRLTISPPSSAALSLGTTGREIAITPDGSEVLYVGANGTTLFARRLDQLDAIPLVRGAAPRDPFVSPDGQWVGFFDGPLTLKKVSITGGPAILIARLNDTELGGTWTPEGTIVFATTTGGLQRVSADGGEPVMFTRPDPEHGEAGHRWPEMLPGGHAVLCTVWPTTGGPDAASIAVLNLRGGRPTILVRGGSHAQYVTSGHLVYAAGGTLRAVRFDPTRPTLLGPSTTVVSQVRTTSVGAADVVVAQGTLAYVAGGAGDARRTLWWVDRQGRETPTGAAPRADYYPRLSPDGRRIVVQTLDHKSDIWIWELARAMWNRVTANPATNYTPVWMPDSRRVIFSSNQTGAQNLFVQDVDGRAAERLTTSPNVQTPTAVSDDGTWLVFDERFPKTGTDVMALRLDGTHQVRPLVQTPFDDRNGIVSPNGRWLAYEADDTGLFEVYVKPFPDVDSGRWQVSMNGGTRPVWARDGRELFYLAQDGAVMRVAVTGGPTWTGGLPTKVLDGRYLASLGGNYQRNYDIAPDGRFLMMKEGISDATGVPPQIVVVENFDEELKRLVPTK